MVRHKQTWSEYIWETVSSPYVIIPSTIIAGVATFYYVKPDEFNAVLGSIGAALSSYFFNNDPKDTPPSDDAGSSNPSVSEPSTSKGKETVVDGVPVKWSEAERKYIAIQELNRTINNLPDDYQPSQALLTRLNPQTRGLLEERLSRAVTERVNINSIHANSDIDSESSKAFQNNSSPVEEVGKAMLNFPWINSEDGNGVVQRPSESSSSDNTPKSNVSNLPEDNNSVVESNGSNGSSDSDTPLASIANLFAMDDIFGNSITQEEVEAWSESSNSPKNIPTTIPDEAIPEIDPYNNKEVNQMPSPPQTPINSSAVLVSRSSEITSSDDERPQEYVKRSADEYNKTKFRRFYK